MVPEYACAEGNTPAPWGWLDTVELASRNVTACAPIAMQVARTTCARPVASLVRLTGAASTIRVGMAP